MDYPFELPPSTGADPTHEVLIVETTIVHIKYETGFHYSRKSGELTKMGFPQDRNRGPSGVDYRRHPPVRPARRRQALERLGAANDRETAAGDVETPVVADDRNRPNTRTGGFR
jgi:hypothetical protein